MTAETDLLPLPEPDYLMPQGQGWPDIPEWSKNTVRQIVAHATAPLQAEIEALRAEVKDYRENGSSAVRFAPNSAHWSAELRRLFGDDARTGIEVLEQRHRDSLARADKLAEALREAKEKMLAQVKWVACDCGCEGEKPADAVSIAWLRASTLLRDQEAGRG